MQGGEITFTTKSRNRERISTIAATAAFAVVLSAVLLFAVMDYETSEGAVGDEFTWDGMVYTITDETNKTVTLTKGADIKSVSLPHKAKKGSDEYRVTAIGEKAFFDMKNVEKVIIHAHSLEIIGKEAFRGCSALNTINIPTSVTAIEYAAFGSCSALVSIELQPAIKTIGKEAFRDSGITGIVIHENVKTLEYRTFFNCTSLKSVDMPSVTQVKEGAFYLCTSLKTVNMPAISSLGTGAFGVCESLESIALPDAVKIIEDDTFGKCKKLASATFPGVTNIGARAFKDCLSLTAIELPSGLTAIGKEAFRGCTLIASVYIPSKVSNIGDSAFFDCSGSVASVEVSADNANYSSVDGMLFDKGKTKLIQGCNAGEVKIPSTVTAFKEWAFYECRSVKTLFFLGDSSPVFGEQSLNMGDRTISAYAKFDDPKPGDFVCSETKVTFFKLKDKYNVTIAAMANGKIKPTGATHQVDTGGDLLIEAVPDKGYKLKSLSLDGNPVVTVGNKYTITFVVSDVQVTAEFEPDGSPTPSPGDSSALIIAVVAIIAIGAAGVAVWFFKFRKP